MLEKTSCTKLEDSSKNGYGANGSQALHDRPMMQNHFFLSLFFTRGHYNFQRDVRLNSQISHTNLLTNNIMIYEVLLLHERVGEE